jgi:hypothetical protein
MTSSGTLLRAPVTSEEAALEGLLCTVSRSRVATVPSAKTKRQAGSPEAGKVYGAMDMGWAKLVSQIAKGYENSPGGAATTSCRARGSLSSKR